MNNIKLVSSYRVKNEEELKKYHSSFIKEGYEGSMLRHSSEKYKVNGRSSSLLKYKDFQDIMVTIIDIEPSEKRPEHGTPVLKYENQKLTGVNSYTFKAGVKMSHADREDLLTNKDKYIGKTGEVRFFEYTDDGLPRFPVLVGFRLDC